MISGTAKLPDISITQLEYLVAVQEAETWAEAAANLGVSQSALSQGLAELQRRLGVELFGWNGRRRIPTSFAHEVTSHALRILSLTSDLSGWTDRVRAGVAGKLRVGMIDAAAVDYFGEILRQFREEKPELDLHISVGPSQQLLDALTAGKLDLAICVATNDPNFTITPLLEEDLYVYGPLSMRNSPAESWGPWVTFPNGSLTRELIRNALFAVGAPFEVIAESNQPEVLSEMVRIGMGWTVLPEIQAQRPPASLVPTHDRPILKRTLVAATRDNDLTNPAATELTSRFLDETK